MPGNIINITPADIAAWPPANYIDPVERNWLPPYAGVLYGVCTVMVGLRLWLRARNQAGRFGIDDVLLLGGWFMGTMFTAVVQLAALRFGINRHAWDNPIAKWEKIALATWLAEFAFLLCGACTKISVLLFYRRLVGGVHTKRWEVAVLIAISFTAAYSLALVFVLIFNCSPTNAYWMAFSPTYHKTYTCVDTTFINLLAGICAIVSDLYSVVLPCLMVSTILMTGAQKIALNLVFSLGLLVVASSAVRTWHLYQVGHESDVSWLLFDVFAWAHLELQLGMMCASAPALRAFFRKYLSSPMSRAFSTDRSQDQAGPFGLNSIVVRQQTPIRDDCSVKHLATESDEEVGVFDTDLRTSPTSTNGDMVHHIKTPADYEAYSLQKMNKFRLSAFEPPASKERRSTVRQNRI